MTDVPPLILLPGLGADARMFAAVVERLPHVTTPAWIEPIPGESVAEYARRFAPVIDPGRSFYLGGASFGGVIAQELAAILPNAIACFVIGSACSERAKPLRIRMLRPITPFAGAATQIAPILTWLLGRWLRPPTRSVLAQLTDVNPRFVRWGAGAILRWKPSPQVADVRIHHIHGDSDRVFPVRLGNPEVIVPGAGHLIAITHPFPVAEFIRERMERADPRF
jgi:pimeloyl-ACP methyl ester carboxylesterase